MIILYHGLPALTSNSLLLSSRQIFIYRSVLSPVSHLYYKGTGQITNQLILLLVKRSFHKKKTKLVTWPFWSWWCNSNTRSDATLPAGQITNQLIFLLMKRLIKYSFRKKEHRDCDALFWSWWCDSNTRPADYESAALPTVLHQRL